MNYLFSFALLGFLFLPLTLHAQVASSSDVSEHLSEKDALQSRIEAKSAELEQVTKQLYESQKNLADTKQTRVGLQQEVINLQNRVRQLELGIQSDSLSLEKLSLEIDSLSYDIRDIERSVDEKQKGVQKLMQQLQQKDAENPLLTFFKGSLADGVFETQAIHTVRVQLADDIQSLVNLKSQMGQKVSAVQEKKQEVELRKKTQAAKKTIIEDQKSSRQVLLSETKNKESLYAQQVAEISKQQDSLENEIQSIEDELRAKFDISVLPKDGKGFLRWPVELVVIGGKGRVTQHYGEKSYLYKGRPHNGLDIGAPVGTAVFAAADGIVSAVDNNDQSSFRKYQYGRYVLIKHSNGMTTIYAHLSKTATAIGATVKRGDLIGYVGATGYATGPHLHFGLYWTSTIELKKIPPAAGLVPVGVTLSPEEYL
jgi:murein DD-endopeptidase MepM/ murein hydrolase activator NlpD